MSAARIITTTEKFDEMGKLVERITTERVEERKKYPEEKMREIAFLKGLIDENGMPLSTGYPFRIFG